MVVRELVAKLGFHVDKGSHHEAQKSIISLNQGLELMHKAWELGSEAVKEFVGDLVDYSGEMNRASQLFGVSRDSMQALTAAADDSGVSFEDLKHGMTMLAKAGVQDLDGEMYRLADQMAALPAGTARIDLALQRFGKNGHALVPMLQKGGAGMRAMADEARELGTIVGDDVVASGVKLKGALKELGERLEGLKRSIGGPFLKTISSVVARVNEWLAANRRLVSDGLERVVLTIARGLDAVWRAGEGAVRVVEWMNERLGKAATAITLVGAAVLIFNGWWLLLAAGVAMVLEEIGVFGLEGKAHVRGIGQAIDELWTKLIAEDKTGWQDRHPIKAFLLDMLHTIGQLAHNWAELKTDFQAGVWGLGKIASAVNRAGKAAATLGLSETTAVQDSKFGSILGGGDQSQSWAEFTAAHPNAEHADLGIPQRDMPGSAAFAPYLPQFGGPTGAAPAPSVSRVNNITVNAKTGADPNEIANAVVSHIMDFEQKENRQLVGALAVP